MKRIAYLCLQATREGQASHAHVHEIIKGLRKRGWTVDLYEPMYARSAQAPGPFWKALEFVRVQLRLWRAREPDVLYIRLHFASWPSAFLARLRGVRVVQEINGPYEDLFIGWPWTRRFAWFFAWLMRSQLRWADVVIAVSPKLAEWCRVEGTKKVCIITNGANTDMFRPDAELDPALELPRSYVVFFGALAPWQGIDTMLAAAEHPSWPQEVQLVIAGDGVERSKVQAAAARSHLIRYLGPQPYSRMPGIVAKSLAGLSPQNDPLGRSSRTELFPLKLFETLACGVPVVVTDFPGMADLVREGGCGLVIPPDDPGALARAVNYLYRHPKERASMGKKGRILVEQEHSWDKRAEATARVLEELLGKGGQ